MVPRLAATVLLLFAATALFAQDKIKIAFEGEGQREVWIQEKGKESEIPERTTVSGKAVEIEVPEGGKDRVVLVHDVKTGDVAMRLLADVLKTGAWNVKAGEATHAFAMTFLVQHDGKPVNTAVVHLTAGGETSEKLVTENDQGMAAFNMVPFGDVQVVVDYESGGEDASLEPQTFESKSGMAEGAPIVLTISDTVETVAPPKEEPEGEEPAATTGDAREEKEEPARTNPFLTVFNMLVGLVIIGGISYGIWRYVKANPDQTADVLSKAGVPVPGDPGSAAVATPKKTGPPQQIILTDAAPTPADTGVAVTAAAAAAVKNPRLVKTDGSLFLVQEGDQTVGRDQATDLPLASESSVSRMHAKLTRTGDSVTVEDTGSTNGTFVNGQRLSGPTALKPGDALQFGAVQFRYEE